MKFIYRSRDRIRSGFDNLLFKRYDSHMQEVARGASVALAVKALAALLALLFQVVLARKLGTDGAGRFLLALTSITLATVIGKFGLDSLMVKYVATNAQLGLWKTIVLVRRNALSISTPVSIGAALILFISAPLLSTEIFHDAGLTIHIRIMSLAVPFLTSAMLHAEMLRGLKHIGTYQFLQGMIVPGIAVISLLVLTPFWGESGAVAGYVFASATAMIAARLFWNRVQPDNPTGGEEITRRELLSRGMPLLWASSMFFLNGWVATIVLGIYGAPRDVALFNAANKLAWLTTFILISVNSIASPKFAAMYRTGSVRELERVAVQTTRLMMLAAVPVLVACLTIPSFLLSLFGSDFRNAAPILRILAVGQIVNVATGSAGQLLIMTGHERDLRNLITSSALLNAVLAVWLAGLFGMLGVACSVSITTVYTSLVAVYFVRRRLNIATHLFQRTAG